MLSQKLPLVLLLSLLLNVLLLSAQEKEQLPKLFPSYSEDFSNLNSYPSLCFKQAFWDDNGKLWLVPCAGVRYTNGINLFQFDGYQFKFVRGDWERIAKGVGVIGLNKDKEIFGFIDDTEPTSLFFFHTETEQIRIVDIKEAGVIQAMKLTAEGRIFLVTAKSDSWYFFEWSENQLQEEGHIEIPEGFSSNSALRSIDVYLDEEKFVVKHGINNYICSIDKNTFQTKRLYATEFPAENVQLDTTTRAWQSDVLKGVGNNSYCLNHEGPDKRLLYLYSPAEEQFRKLNGIPNNWTILKMASDQLGNQLYVFEDLSNPGHNPGLLIDTQGQRYDYSALFVKLKHAHNANYYSPNFKEQLFICHQGGILLQRIKSDKAIQHFMPRHSIRAITELLDQGFLIGTQFSGDQLLDLKSGAVTPFQVPGCFFHTGGLRTTYITDPAGNIWSNSPNEIFKYQPQSNSCTSFPMEGAEIHSFVFTKENQLALIDKNWQLFLFSLSTNKGTPVRIDGKKVQFAGYVHDFLCDQKGVLWVATSKGFWKVNLSSNELLEVSAQDGFLDNRFLCIDQDETGKIWLGTTLGGLHIYDPAKDAVQTLNSKNGLANNTIATIQKDQDGDRWLGTYNGISVVSKEGKLIANLSVSDGLIEKENNRYAKFLASDGLLFMGTVKGLNVINTKEIKQRFSQQEHLKIYLTALSYYDAEAGETRQQLYGLIDLPLIELPASKRNIELNFALSNYFNPELNQFAYQLKGLDEDWTFIGNQPFLSLSNLPPGRYELLIRGSNAIGKWTEQPLSISIFAKEYFYKQNWFYVLCFLLILIAGGIVAMIWIRQLSAQVKRATFKIQSDKELIEQQAEQLRELDKAKSRFFTNISHEFRTPLTIISGMIGRLRANPGKWLEEGSLMIQRNSDNLLNLVNQILDLRKLESGKLTVNMVQEDIIAYLRYIFKSFQPLAQEKNIQLHFLGIESKRLMDYDPEKVLRIITNLLSNAIKFTPENGNVYLVIREELPDEQPTLAVEVKDTGIGIPEKKLPHIFEQFYQVDSEGAHKKQGTGIGLSLCKELVELLGGTIKVESEVGKGTAFTIRLTIRNKAPFSQDSMFEEKVEALPKKLEAVSVHPSPKEVDPSAFPLVLLIDDNQDVIQYLVACLEENYKIETAENGQEGVDKAIEIIPDIIISDVMMPIMDGFEVCNVLKTDERTSHIPIILLTAKADHESRMSGLKKGADEYLTKPFQQEELLIRLHNISEYRRKLQQHFQKTQPLPSSANESLQQEDEFLQKIRKKLEENIADGDYGIVHICHAVRMSRTQVHRKIKALTGQSTSIFLRRIRLDKGKELLETSEMNVSEVAYAVGFNNPGYFSRLYFEEFGERPNVTRK